MLFKIHTMSSDNSSVVSRSWLARKLQNYTYQPEEAERSDWNSVVTLLG
jgi:hypothetical protein